MLAKDSRGMATQEHRLLGLVRGPFRAINCSLKSFAIHERGCVALQAFKGIWRMQARSDDVTRLSYSLHVQPQRWLPVRLIQSRIEGEIAVNLNAVRVYTEQMSRL